MANDPIALMIPGDKHDLVLERDEITIGKTTKIQHALNDVKRRHNPYSRMPRKKVPEMAPDKNGKQVPTGKMVDESEVDWTARVIEELAKLYAKEEGESDEAYDARVNRLNLEDHFVTVCYDFIVEVCKIFGREVLAKEDYENVPIERARVFCYDLLAHARIEDPTGLFFPRRTAKDLERALASGGN